MENERWRAGESPEKSRKGSTTSFQPQEFVRKSEFAENGGQRWVRGLISQSEPVVQAVLDAIRLRVQSRRHARTNVLRAEVVFELRRLHELSRLFARAAQKQ